MTVGVKDNMPTRVCVKVAYEYGPNWTKTYEGPAGLASPRWSCTYEDALGRTIAETRTGFRCAPEARIVSRGASAVHVTGKISNNALVLSIK